MSVKEFESAVKPLSAACDGLPADDPLLGPQRAICPELAKFAKAGVDVRKCGEFVGEFFVLILAGNGEEASEKCLAAVTRMRDAFKQLDETSRVAGRSVRLTRLPPGCKRALTSSEESHEHSARFVRAFDSMLRGARKGHTPAEERAAREAVLSLGEEDDSKDAQRDLDLLRRHCH